MAQSIKSDFFEILLIFFVSISRRNFLGNTRPVSQFSPPILCVSTWHCPVQSSSHLYISYLTSYYPIRIPDERKQQRSPFCASVKILSVNRYRYVNCISSSYSTNYYTKINSDTRSENMPPNAVRVLFLASRA